MAPGRRQVALVVTDAAGNTSQSATYTVNVTGPPDRGAANGTNASDHPTITARFVHGNRSRITVSNGRHATIRGRLTDEAGHPIARAALHVLVRSLRTGAVTADRHQVVTGPDGTFAYVSPPGPSRSIHFTYLSHANDAGPSGSAGVVEHVRAAARFSVRPHQTRNGGAVRFRGRLRGGSIPPGGKLVDLQALDSGRWRTFATVRTSHSGRFGYRYRFTRTFQPSSYRFRAVVHREADYPFSFGLSRSVGVRVA
jgi:hypothetical protein